MKHSAYSSQKRMRQELILAQAEWLWLDEEITASWYALFYAMYPASVEVVLNLRLQTSLDSGT